MDLSVELGLKEAEANTYRAFSMINKKLGKLGKAKLYLEKSIGLLEELDNPYNLGKSYCEYGRVLEDEGNNKGARMNLQKALDIFKDLGAKKDREYVEKIMKNL